MANWDIKDLEYWDDAVRERVAEYGLACYPQEFEICDHAQMLGYTAYHGMPAHYPHWSYGKSYEKTKTIHRPHAADRESDERDHRARGRAA
jgi:stage V sporulation protein R